MAATGGRISSRDPQRPHRPGGRRPSIDVYRLDGYREHAKEGNHLPYERLQVEGVHMLRWDGRPDRVEGRSALFADGVTQGNLWWSPVGADRRAATSTDTTRARPWRGNTPPARPAHPSEEVQP
ncbi:hypothetical protein [Microbacterium terregens]|uniref:hypothetical protein n=1 Tax=Microbacterium terregens TaxID=69363 RepID=UPI0031D09B18